MPEAGGAPSRVVDDDLARLDRLLGRTPSPRWWPPALDDLRERWAWLAAFVVVAAVTAGVLVMRDGVATQGTTELPRAGAGSSPTTAPSNSPSNSAANSASGSVASSPVTGSTAVAGPVVVHVAGAVVAPGLVALSGGARVADAVAAAGGGRTDADLERVNLAAPLADGARVYVPAVGQETTPVVVGPTGGPPASGAAGSSSAAPLDLNSATAEQLDDLPGVGPATATAIVAYRDANGPFRSVDELQEVRGIGPAKFATIEPLVVAG